MKGDGCVRNRGKDRWEVQVSLGRDPETGRYRKVSRTVHGSRADACRRRDELRLQMRLENRTKAGPDGAVTLAELIRASLDAWRARGSVNETTLHKWSIRLGQVTDLLGDMSLDRVTPQAIEGCYAQIRARTGLGATTMDTTHWLLSRAFRAAVGSGLVAENPCDKVSRPGRGAPVRKSLSAEEILALRQGLDELETTVYAVLNERERRRKGRGESGWRCHTQGLSRASVLTAVRIALATGMRRGEIIDLGWDSVDLGSRQIRVVQYGETAKTETGKSEQPGSRSIYIDANTARHLALWKERQALELSRIGLVQEPDSPVCCSSGGWLIDVAEFKRLWRACCEQVGFPDLTITDLRNTQAVQLLSAGVDVKTVQLRLGHSWPSHTLKLYAGAMPEDDASAAATMARIMREGTSR